MTDDRCRYTGATSARVLVGRHRDGCDNPACEGCQECTRAHCRGCGHEHAASVCPGCVGAVREDLSEIARMVGSLPEEAEHRGVNSEAMVLLGPTVDPEAWQHHEASWLAGRAVPVDCDAHDLDELQAWLETADSDRHPLLVLGRLEMVARDLLEHETDERVTVAAAVRYLDVQLTHLAGNEWFDWRDMASDVRGCRGHLEDVLHDGERVETGAPCVQCQTRLQRHVTEDGREWWWCRFCKRNLTDDQYRYAVGAAYRTHADRLPAADLAERVDVPASTIRRWAAVRRGDDGTELPPLLLSVGRDHNKRKVYRVADAETLKAQMRDNPGSNQVA